MKSATKLLSALSLAILLASCSTTRTTVGDGPIGRDPNVIQYSKAKQFYLFSGLIPLGIASAETPPDKNCQVKSYYTLFDIILSSVTGGILTTRTTKVLVKQK